jgi:hypothetical protein
MMRRRLAAGAVVLVIVLALFGIRGCLDARKERGFENFASDLSSVAAEAQNISQQFFGRLQNPGERSPLQIEAEIKADRGAMDGLLSRVESLDGPADLDEAKRLLTVAYELRAEGLAGASEAIPLALSEKGSQQGSEALAEEMRTLLASDVMDARAIAEVESALAAEGVTVPGTEEIAVQFVPDQPDWLDPTQVMRALEGAADESGNDAERSTEPG